GRTAGDPGDGQVGHRRIGEDGAVGGRRAGVGDDDGVGGGGTGIDRGHPVGLGDRQVGLGIDGGVGGAAVVAAGVVVGAGRRRNGGDVGDRATDPGGAGDG